MAKGTFIIAAENKIRDGLDAAKRDLNNFSNEAQKAGGGVNDLNEKTTALNKIFGGFVITAGDVVNAVKSIAQAAYSTVEAYAVQEKAVFQLNAAIKLSDKVSEDSKKSLTDFASAIQNMTGVGDEAVISLEAMLIASGRNEQQTRKLISAAADYSAATGKDMKNAVEELNKTFSGTEGRLGMLIPALKDLTDEQLKNGAAIDIVAAQYAGFAAELTATADVSITKLKAAWGDLLEEIGRAITPAITPIINEVTDFIQNKAIPGIRNFFTAAKGVIENLPMVTKETLNLIVEMIRLAFSWDTLSAIFTALAENILRNIGTAISMLPGIFLNVIQMMYNPVKSLGEYIADTLSKAFSGKIKEIASPGDFLAGLFEKQLALAGEVVSGYIEYSKTLMGSSETITTEIGDIFGPLFNQFLSRIRGIIGPLEETVNAATGGGTGNQGGSGGMAPWSPSGPGSRGQSGLPPPGYSTTGQSVTEQAMAQLRQALIDVTTGENLGSYANRLGAIDETLFDENTKATLSLIDEMFKVEKWLKTLSGNNGQSALAPGYYDPGTALEQVMAMEREYLIKLANTLSGKQAEKTYSQKYGAFDESAAGWVEPKKYDALLTSGPTEEEKAIETRIARAWKSLGEKQLQALQAEFTIPQVRQAPAGYGERDDYRAQAGQGSIATTISEGLTQAFNTVTSGMGDFGTSMLGPISELMSALGPFGNMIAGMNPLLAILLPVIEGFTAVLAPVIQSVLAPLMDALMQVGVILGQMLLPIFDVLAPIIALLANILITNLTPILQILTPIFQVIAAILQPFIGVVQLLAKVFTILMSPVQYIADMFSWLGGVLQTFAWNVQHPFKSKEYSAFSSNAFSGLQDRLNAIDAMAVNNQTFQTSALPAQAVVASIGGSSAATASQSASYRTQAITVNIYQQAPVVGSGGMTEFARMVRGEIMTLGYYGV